MAWFKSCSVKCAYPMDNPVNKYASFPHMVPYVALLYCRIWHTQVNTHRFTCQVYLIVSSRAC